MGFQVRTGVGQRTEGTQVSAVDSGGLAKKTDNGAPPPDVSVDPNTRPVHRAPETDPGGVTFGRLRNPLIAAAFLALGFSGCAAHGQTLDTVEINPTPIVATVPVTTQSYERLLAELEQRRDRGQITPQQFERAKDGLVRALLNHDGTTLPLDHRGRVDIDVLVDIGAIPPNEAGRTRGQIVFDRLGRQLEMRMRITARDMASGDYTAMDGAPGYKELEPKVVGDLMLDALQDVPLNEITGGQRLARLITALPNAGGIDAQNMSFSEISRAVGDANAEWLNAKFEKLVDGHELEVGVVAFAAVTGLRAASPEAAAVIDRLSPRMTILRKTSDDGRRDGRIRLRYRDQHVLPDVDFEARTRYVIGETTLRAGLIGTVSAEADDIFSATATVGARRAIGSWWVDAAGAYRTDIDRWNAQVRTGTYDSSSTWNFSTGLSATFGDGVAVGDADGQLRWETDLTRDVRMGGAVGDFGLYTGVRVDSDGKNEDLQTGIVFRLRF